MNKSFVGVLALTSTMLTSAVLANNQSTNTPPKLTVVTSSERPYQLNLESKPYIKIPSNNFHSRFEKTEISGCFSIESTSNKQERINLALKSISALQDSNNHTYNKTPRSISYAIDEDGNKCGSGNNKKFKELALNDKVSINTNSDGKITVYWKYPESYLSSVYPATATEGKSKGNVSFDATITH